MRPAIALLAMLAFPAPAAQEDFLIDPAHTYPSFEVGHLGISTQRGRFNSTKGRIVLDRAAGTGTIEIVIDSSAVSTGNALLDAVLRSEDFFDVERFPAMTFRSSSIAFEGGVPKRASGVFTMVGVTRPIEVSVARFACTRLPFFVQLTCGADVVASLKRSEFGITAFSLFVGDEVKLLIQVEAVLQESAAQPQPAGG
jgi:polyisoprenoid-binding protein YceI